MVLSDRAWRKYFAADPTLVGRSVSLNGKSYAVIGIAPPGFNGPVLGQAPEMWVPMALQAEVRPPSAGFVAVSAASNLLSGARDRLAESHRPASRSADHSKRCGKRRRRGAAARSCRSGRESRRRFTVVPLGEGPGMRTAARPLLRALAASVGMVLLIACANVASLLVVRALSVRKSGGRAAGTWRLAVHGWSGNGSPNACCLRLPERWERC